MSESTAAHILPAVCLTDLTKRFGWRSVLKEINCTLAPGEFLTVFGPNGAGKTTLLRILATLTSPTSGQGALWGYDLAQEGEHIRRLIGVLTHHPLLFPTLTAYENLRFYGRMFQTPDLPARIATLLQEVGLSAHHDRLVETFSRGMQQRLAIARAVLHAPRLLLLDEPYTGLDPEGIDFFTQTLQAFHAQGGTVIMTSHDFEQGLALCTKATILYGGKLVYYGDPATRDEPFAAVYQRCVGTSPTT